MTFPLRFDQPLQLQLVSVNLYGKRGHLRRKQSTAHLLAERTRGTLTTTILPPTRPPHPGLGYIDRRCGEIEADGALVPSAPRAVVIGHSRDCPYVIVENVKTGLVGVAHAGRWSLTHNVIANLVRTISSDGDCSRMTCFITGGIRPDRFLHDTAPELVDVLRRRHAHAPEPIFTDESRLTLDLFAVIRNELCGCGVPKERITDDGLCTFAHPDLSSKRADDAGMAGNTEMNWVVVQRLC